MTRIGIVSAMLALSTSALAVSTPFTFQGSLEDAGVPANGSYDLQFVVKNTTGSALSSPITLEDVAVVGGVFTVSLDFGDFYFSGVDRRLSLSVRPGASSGAFVALSPDLPINATPYALTSNDAIMAITAVEAQDVVNGSINAVDLADSAVSTQKLQNNAVTADKLASNSVSIASLIGGSGSGAISITVSANDCSEFNLNFAGAVAGDFVMVNTDPLPDDLIITAMNIPAANVVRIKACNVGPASQSVSNLGIRYISFR